MALSIEFLLMVVSINGSPMLPRTLRTPMLIKENWRLFSAPALADRANTLDPI